MTSLHSNPIFSHKTNIYNAMRKSIPLFSLLLIPMLATAQKCVELYDYFKEGITLEYTNYDKKGKAEMVTTQKVTSLTENADTVIATIGASAVNEKGKDLYSNVFPIKCHEGVIYMDMRSLVPPQQNAGQSPDMQMEIKSNDLIFPADMKPGQSLPDSEMELTVRMGGLQIMNNKYYIKNRKVEAEENVTTPAGTYKCLKISYDFEFKMLGTRTYRTEYWYSQAVGMVKSINYDKKGNVESRTELTKFSQ